VTDCGGLGGSVVLQRLCAHHAVVAVRPWSSRARGSSVEAWGPWEPWSVRVVGVVRVRGHERARALACFDLHDFRFVAVGTTRIEVLGLMGAT